MSAPLHEVGKMLGGWQKQLVKEIHTHPKKIRRRIRRVAEQEAIVVVPLIVRMILVDVQLALRTVAVEVSVPELDYVR
jgi:hypothetical protein